MQFLFKKALKIDIKQLNLKSNHFTVVINRVNGVHTVINSKKSCILMLFAKEKMKLVLLGASMQGVARSWK